MLLKVSSCSVTAEGGTSTVPDQSTLVKYAKRVLENIRDKVIAELVRVLIGPDTAVAVDLTGFSE